MGSPEPHSKKKAWSGSALFAAMEPSAEELEYREEKSRETDFVQKYSKLFKCTKCQSSMKPIIVRHNKVTIHPSLGVLMCQRCCDFYEDGEFSLDSDGEDKYCRWCGEGGTILGCSKCISGFCAKCIKRHFKNEYFRQVKKDENWLCFFCNPKPLWDERFICALAVKMSEEGSTSSINSEGTPNVEEDVKTPVKSLKRRKLSRSKRKGQVGSPKKLKNTCAGDGKKVPSVYSNSSDESDFERPQKKVKHTSATLEKLIGEIETESFEKMKFSVLSELKKILTLSQHQMDFGITWSNKMLEKLATPDHITNKKGLAVECQKIKQFLSILSTFLLQFSTSVDSVEKNLLRNEEPKIQLDSTNRDQGLYNNILQFLAFVKSQVKIFMEKGISLPDVVAAEVYDDDKIIGLKKKSQLLDDALKENKSKSTISGDSFKSNAETPTKMNTEESKIEELEKIVEDDILQLVGNQTTEKDEFDSEGLDERQDSAHTALCDSNEIKPVESKDDIRDILEVLESV